jgi:hypothetical protein
MEPLIICKLGKKSNFAQTNIRNDIKDNMECEIELAILKPEHDLENEMKN